MCRKENREPHYDIWSIPAGKFRWYITLLLTSGSAVCAYLIYGSVGSPEHATGQDLTRAIITDVILSYTGAAVGSFVVIKGGEPLMVLAHFLREKLNKRSERLQQEAQTRGLNQGLAEGLAQGQAEGLAEGWPRARLPAAPPPTLNGPPGTADARMPKQPG